MMPAVKHLDPLLGVDVHIVQPPGPVPPIPVPHPYVGMVFDPFDYLPVIGATLKINGLPRAQAGTSGIALPPHIPIGGVFVKPPSNDSELFMGSSTVSGDGEALSYMMLPVLSCQDIGIPPIPRIKKKSTTKSLVLPTTLALSIPMGAPVLIGGAPTVSLSAMAMKAGMAVFGRILKKLRALQRTSRRMRALSARMRHAADTLMDKLGVGQRGRNRMHRAICTLTGHPVDVATGKVLTEAVDFALPGPLPLAWRRVWFSTSRHEGELGHGWHHPFDMAVIPSPEVMLVRLEDGRHVPFAVPRQGRASWNEQERLELRRESLAFVLEMDNGVQYHFGFAKPGAPAPIALPLTRIEDTCGNAIGFVRKKGRLTRIDDSAGRTLFVHTDNAGRIVSVDGPAPYSLGTGPRLVLVRYEYSSTGDLLAAYDACGAAQRFAYQKHLLVQETLRDGTPFSFEYDRYDSSGRCIRTWGRDGIFERRFTYDDERHLTHVTDSRGARTLYEWSALGLVTRRVDALGCEFRVEYDDAGAILAETNALGEVTRYTRDERQRVTCIEEPTGDRSFFVYDDAGALTQVTHPDGTKTVREYDARGNLVRMTDAGGYTWLYEVDARGLRTREVDPAGNVFTYGWSGEGDLILLRDALGGESLRVYDVLGRLVRRSDALGRDHAYHRDACGRVTQVSGPGGAVRDFQYDAAGNLVEDKDALGYARRYVYGPLGRCLQAWEPTGSEVCFQYDSELALTGIRDATHQDYRLVRDELGRVKDEVSFGGRHYRYEYDGADRLVSRVDGRGLRTHYAYDALGRCVRRGLADGDEELFRYDAAGRLVEATNGSAKVERRYAAGGRLVSERINGDEVRYEYDAVGNRVARHWSRGRRLELAYDARQDLTGISDGKGSVLRMARDALGREVRCEQRGGLVRHSTFSTSGRVSSRRVTREGKEVARWEGVYDVLGQLKGARTENEGVTLFFHDESGRLVRARYPDETEEVFTRDAAGNMLGAPTGEEGGADSPLGWALRYDANGNLVEKRGGSSAWHYDYDLAGRLVSVEGCADPERMVRVEFGYDALGRRISKRIQEGERQREVTFAWDLDVLLGEVETARGGVGSGSKGERIREYLARPGDFELLASFDMAGESFVESDGNATPRLALDAAGNVVWRAELSAFGRVRGESTGALALPIRFPGQYEDRETGLHYNRFRYYDPSLGLYLSVDPLGYEGGLNLWNYVPSPADGSDPFGLVHETTPGYSVYGLYDPPGPPTKQPYYIGITNDVSRRQTEHVNSGRLDPNASSQQGGMHVLDSDVDYGTARGYEQAYVELHKTRTGNRGDPISTTNRGNKVNSFDHGNTTRLPDRQKHFEDAYEQRMKALGQTSPCH